MVPLLPITLNAPLYDPSGFAEDVRFFVRCLHRMDYPFAIEPCDRTPQRVPLDSRDKRFLDGLPRARHNPPRALWNYTSPQHFMQDPQAVCHIGRGIFETDRLPNQWIPALESQDLIWVASTFNQKTFIESGIPENKIRVLPNGLDTDIFKPEGPGYPLDTGGRQIFLSVFDFNPRKNLESLLVAWAQSFTAEDNVCLVLKTYSSAGLSTDQVRDFINQCITALGKTAEQIAPIHIVDEILSLQQMASLYRKATAYVLPTHGEGWGRTLMEAMSCGLPVIASRWSAHLDFMNDENSYLIDGSVVDVPDIAIRYSRYFMGHRWFEPDADHLSELLKQVINNPDEARQKGLKASAEIRSRFSFESVGVILKNLLAEVR